MKWIESNGDVVERRPDGFYRNGVKFARWFVMREVIAHAGALASGPGPLAPSDMTSLDLALAITVQAAIRCDLNRLTHAAK